MTATHDVDALAGADCAGCATDDPRPSRRYLILAARNTYGAGAICGHWHAEHATDDRETAEELVRELVTRHADVVLCDRDGSRGRYAPISAASRGDRREAAPCCQPIDEPARSSFQTADNMAGARCFACGDLRARWTHPAAEVA